LIDASLKGYGFKMHPTFIVDAATLFPIGWSDIHIWNRAEEKLHDITRQEMRRTPIVEKESYKWIKASQRSKEVLKSAASLIIVQDREGDIYDQFIQVPDDKTFLLIRSRCDRNLTDEGKLWGRVKEQPCCGTYSIVIDSDSRSKQPKREAIIEVRYVTAEIKKAQGAGRNKKSVVVNMVEAREVTTGIEDPIEWKLITTLPVKNFEDACQIIEWYTCRWMIEEVFRILKKEGYNIEGSEMESGWAIRKLTIMIMDTIVKLFQMQYAYSIAEGEQIDATVCFDEKEVQCFTAVNPKMEGKTDKQKNPYKPKSLAWATWILARLGGWKGYQSQRPPGITTWFNGLKKFYALFEGWNLQIDVGTR
jgi:hypothetical protein